MTVEMIMSRKIVTVDMDDTLARIRDVFKQHRFHHVLVVSGNRLMGVISDRDLLKSISPFIDTLSETTRDLATLQKRAHQIMSRKPISVAQDTTLEDAVETLLQHNISCLPVTNKDGAIVGVLTWKDLLRASVKV
ncbi:CBS domain-containing protein [Candidatus Nitronereus thalassa]|uniref:CBS domain-containing protein n=1 Tax=Candidatus Nitronereus thalassa TaxID=3020898 RepID=A0ABU3K7S9_9BACT|nr:CBS domain-containing protein [Candidatus Nitronereus thalassa]MDT7042440.1 CBS domain-containing protein [Candidatus Nitronereus thalassa]